MSERAPAVIIGAGPAGLIAADVLSAAGVRVVVIERMPSVGRKFLIAGRGGLNLTHSEPLAQFVTRYGAAADNLRPMLESFSPRDLIAWVEGLGQPTFVGSSGRVFPKAMKASPLLRACLARLNARGVEIRARTQWQGWHADGRLLLSRGAVEDAIEASATLLALGGASWPKLGADGAWQSALASRGVAMAPLKPANMGFEVAWSAAFRARFEGQPLKSIVARFDEHEAPGEIIVTNFGVEGGAIYALSAHLRDALELQDPIELLVDLKPALSKEQIASRLGRAKGGDSLSSTLRKALNLTPLATNLLREGGPPPRDPEQLAALIKAMPITLVAPCSIDRAISTAGGVTWSAVDEHLQLRVAPNTYVAGEMLDWEAPTGGYLLQACFATGVWAARAMLKRIRA